MNDVSDFDDYKNQIRQGLNEFLDYSECRMYINNESEEYAIYTLSESKEDLGQVERNNIFAYSFMDGGGEFRFGTVDESHFEILILESPNWSKLEMGEHIGEAIGCIIDSKNKEISS